MGATSSSSRIRGTVRVSDHRNQNVWAQSLDGGTPRHLTDFKTDQTFSFDWSRDGKLLALTRGTQVSDVDMITDFK